MKKISLPIILSLILLTSCDFPFHFPWESNSQSESNSETITDTETLSNSQTSVSESISETKYYKKDSITLDGSYVHKIYSAEEIIDLSKDEKNYIVLNDKNEIIYSVGKSKTFSDVYLSFSDLTIDLSSYLTRTTFKIPSSSIGYEIDDEGYSYFMSTISGNEIAFTDLDLARWNVIDNEYLLSSLKVLFEGEFDIKAEIIPINEEEFRLSSIYDVAINDEQIYKMKAPYTDSYKISCNQATSIELYDELGKSIISGTKSFQVPLYKDDICYLKVVVGKGADFQINVTPNKNKIKMPYDIYDTIDASNVPLTSDNKYSSYEVPTVTYTKRQNDGRGLYVNCNNPEKINSKDLNKCLARQDITDKEVFFTFEHNNYAGQSYYYGYRVTNTGNSDVYITVENLGYQVSGKGTWLGEDEWTKFYNLAFREDLSSLSQSQRSNYDAYVGFALSYKSADRQPITYRIPKGKYIYVMGGTSQDAYKKIDVFDSADVPVKGACGNGAVLFDVRNGQAEGSFLLYTSATTINNSSSVTSKYQQGYVVTYNGTNYGSQYLGYDDCHGVVDGQFLYKFNDATTSRSLACNFTNSMYNSGSQTGTPFSKIPNLTKRQNYNATTWVTHINPNGVAQAFGSDMTYYKVYSGDVDDFVTIEPSRYDGRGKAANIGNWMVDYQDHFTLINQGNKDRKITFTYTHNGVILGFVRNEDGSICQDYTPQYFTKIAKSSYGDAVEHLFTYTVTIPAHSQKKITLEYNLLANSNGYIAHEAYLI